MSLIRITYESSSEIFHWDERTQEKKKWNTDTTSKSRRNELIEVRKATYEMNNNNNNDTKTHTKNITPIQERQYKLIITVSYTLGRLKTQEIYPSLQLNYQTSLSKTWFKKFESLFVVYRKLDMERYLGIDTTLLSILIHCLRDIHILLIRVFNSFFCPLWCLCKK